MARLKYGRIRVRTRHQDGWVEERGKRHKRWYGHYYTYEMTPEGKERRRHVGVQLGEKAKMRKWEAEQALRRAISAAAVGIPQCDEQTLRWFVEQRFLPLKMARWEPSTRETNLGLFKNQILPALGDEPIGKLDKFKCQMFLNKLAEDDYSFTIVDHCRTTLKAIFAEAVDADLVLKDPTRKLENPVTRDQEKLVLANSDARRLLDSLPFRDRLIAMIAAFCAMRPGEIFGLRWSSWRGDHFQIEGTAWRGVLRPGKAKTKGSKAPIVIPDALRPLMDFWRAKNEAPQDALIFPSTKGTPMRPENWLRRRIKPTAEELGIKGSVCFQVLRRTFATNAQVFGNPKDVQAHLRHASITTTMDVYTQPVGASVRKLVNDVTDGVLSEAKVN